MISSQQSAASRKKAPFADRRRQGIGKQPPAASSKPPNEKDISLTGLVSFLFTSNSKRQTPNVKHQTKKH